MALSDFKTVDWLATAKLALARGFASAVVLTLAGLILGSFSTSQGGWGAAIRFLFFWTFAAAVGGVVYIWILQAIAATLGRAVAIVVTVTNILRLVVILLVAIGDPLVYLLNRQFPHVLNVRDFKLVNMVAIIFIQHDHTSAVAFDKM